MRRGATEISCTTGTLLQVLYAAITRHGRKWSNPTFLCLLENTSLLTKKFQPCTTYSGVPLISISAKFDIHTVYANVTGLEIVIQRKPLGRMRSILLSGMKIVGNSKKKASEIQLVDAVVKALGILDCFSKHEPELSLNQFCEKTGLYKSRIHRLCGTLIAIGYLVKTSRSNYRLGPKLLVLGKVYENTNSLRSIAEPFMQGLSAKTGQSTALFVLDGMQCICMAREVGSARLVYSITEGDNMILTPTASGRVLLAFGEEKFTEKVLQEAKHDEGLGGPAFDLEETRSALIEVREKGYAINKTGLEEGSAALAAPIFDFEHNIAAALAIVGPAHRFSDDRCGEMVQSLLTVTTEISRLMGES